MAAEKGIHQRIWQAGDLDDGHQAGACDLPEWRLEKAFPPEDLPAGDGPAVGAEARGKLTDTAWGRSLPHGADQDDDDTQVDLGPKEADRRWCPSLPATIAVTAEAQFEALLLGELSGSAARFAKVVGTVQAPATRACFPAGLLSEILVNGQEERPEPGGPRQFMIHRRVLRSRDKPRSTPLGKLDPVIRLFEGNFVACLSDVAQKRPISHRLACARTEHRSRPTATY